MEYDDTFTEEAIAEANANEDEFYKAVATGGGIAPALIHTASVMNALLNVKRNLYKHFLNITEDAHEQNIDIMVTEYPTFLSKWADILVKGPVHMELPADDIPDFLKTALEDLKHVMSDYMETDPYFWEDKMKYMVRTLFIQYPYALNREGMSA